MTPLCVNLAPEVRCLDRAHNARREEHQPRAFHRHTDEHAFERKEREDCEHDPLAAA